MLLCSCSTMEYVTEETVYEDTLVTVERPVIFDTVELHLETHAEVLPESPSTAPKDADTCVFKGRGKSGIIVAVRKKEGKTFADVIVPADSVTKLVTVEGTKTETRERQLSWIEQLIDDIPAWAWICALCLSIGFLIYMIKR